MAKESICVKVEPTMKAKIQIIAKREGRGTADAEYVPCLGRDRHLARRKLELYCVGLVLFCAAGH